MNFFGIFRYLGYFTLSLATLEISAQIDDYLSSGAPLFKPYSINTLFRPSPYGREGVPDAVFAKWKMNHLGYRGPEPIPTRSTVLTFGASETFGLYESKDHEYPRLLEAELNKRQPAGYNVVNIAIPGMRVGRISYLKHALDQTNAQFVVIYPSPANYIGTTTPFCGQPDTPTPSAITWADTFRLLGKIDQKSKVLLPVELMSAFRRFSIWRATRNQTLVEQVPDSTINALREDLSCAIKTIKEHGATPILVTHASYFGDHLEPEDANMLLAWRRFYPELAEAGFLDLERRANAAIRSLAEDQHVAIADAARDIPKGATHFADFVHFTDQGATKMASLVAKTIKPTTTTHP